MKAIAICLALGLAALGAVATPSFAAEENADKKVFVKIAVIDIEGVLRRAKVVKNIGEQIKTYRTEFQTEIQKEEEQLRKDRQELKRQQNIVSKEVFDGQLKEFEEKLTNIQKLLQVRGRELERVQAEAKNAVRKKMEEIVTEVANKNDLTLIMRTDQLVFWAQPLDISLMTLEKLDKIMPTYTVKKPEKIDPSTLKVGKPGGK